MLACAPRRLQAQRAAAAPLSGLAAALANGAAVAREAGDGERGEARAMGLRRGTDLRGEGREERALAGESTRRRLSRRLPCTTQGSAAEGAEEGM